MNSPIDWSFWGVIPAKGAKIRVWAVNLPVVAVAFTPNWKPYFWVLVALKASPSGTLSIVTAPAAPPAVMLAGS